MIQGDTPSSGGSTPIPPKQPLPTSDSPTSTKPRRASITVPEASAADASESSSIQQHLDRRRKSFHLPTGKKKPSLGNLRADSQTAAWFEQMNDVDEDEAEEAAGVDRTVTFDMEELRRKMPEAVKMLHAGGEECMGVDLDAGLKRGYAWDVMFENQRGIHFLGKAYFSSNSLLPSDPSHFTLPSHPLASASTLLVSTPDHSGGPDRPVRTTKPSRIADRIHKPKHDPSTGYNVNFGEHHINLSSEHRNIKTAYSLATFQCPGPQWEWVTPWMINMKVGTDEGGWRYNAWFKNKGWRNHAGPAGWAGWVRRREWVRLRMVRPIGEGDGGDEGAKEKDESHEKEKSAKRLEKRGLGHILREDQGFEALEDVLHVLSSIPLDREKLVWWSDGLKKAEGDEHVRSTLQDLLDDSDNVKSLHRAFTHRSTFTSFITLLEAHHYSLAPLPPTYLPPPQPAP